MHLLNENKDLSTKTKKDELDKEIIFGLCVDIHSSDKVNKFSEIKSEYDC